MDKIIKNIDSESEIGEIINIIKKIQNNIDNNNTNIDINNNEKKSLSRSTFIYGENGVGKTTLIKKILSQLNYNIHEFNLLCQKNKSITDFFDEYNCKNRDIMDIFHRINNNSVILIDNIDIISSIDKNILTSIIKILRPKKNKKYSHEDAINTQIIIIGSNDTDKKMKELMKLCNVIKIDPPSRDNIYNSINKKLSNNNFLISNKIYNFLNASKNINYYLVDKFINLYNTNSLDNFLKYSCDNKISSNVKHINYDLLKTRMDFIDDNHKINDTDRTTVSLLYHENIIDYILQSSSYSSLLIYKKILENFCFGDYIDRIIFQKQLWQLNEISFKIKVLYNNKIFHDYLEKYNIRNIVKLNNVRFTKILTKYSSEFNNYSFIINMCQVIDIDKKDLLLFFYVLKNNPYQFKEYSDILINRYDISILDINRLVKFVSVSCNPQE